MVSAAQGKRWSGSRRSMAPDTFTSAIYAPSSCLTSRLPLDLGHPFGCLLNRRPVGLKYDAHHMEFNKRRPGHWSERSTFDCRLAALPAVVRPAPGCDVALWI